MPIPDALRPYLRTAWFPRTEDGLAPPDASSFSGLAWIPEGEAWPVCPTCGKPMQLFVQLNPADLPEPVRERVGEGLIQFFYCTTLEPMCDIDLEGWAPFSKAHVARRVTLEGTPSLAAPPQIEDPYPPKRIVGWEPRQDAPTPWEREVEEAEISDEAWREAEDFPLAGDKLGGWPLWIQGPERPACPRCNGEMEVILQLDSEDHLPHLFGDVGVGHLSICPRHPEMVAFGWACT